MQLFSTIVKRCLALTPFEIRRRDWAPALPEASFDSIRLALSCYQESEQAPTFVQIGACDGVSGDPVHPFVRKGWMRSVLVEPITQSVEKLRSVYSDVSNVTIVQAAIAGHDGTVKFYKIKDDEARRGVDPNWPLQVSTLQREHLIKHRVADKNIEEITVPCLTLQTLLTKCSIEKVDILQIDTEGFDAEVVKMALRLPILPECINFEHIHLKPEVIKSVFDELRENGYSWVHDRWNTLAIHNKFIDALERRSLCRVRDGVRS